MSSTKPVIVLVPGAWTIPHSYHKLVSVLQAAPYNYIVHVLALPSNNGAQRPNTFDDDTAAVRSVVEPLVVAGHEVILLMHSYGGAVGGSSVEGLSRKERQAADQLGGVVHLVYLSAYLLKQGQSVWDVLVEGGGDTPERKALVEFKDNGTWLPVDPISGLYHDLKPEDQEEQKAGIRPHFLSALLAPAKHEAWKHTPSTYIYTTEDRWVPPAFQDICISSAQQAGAQIEVHKLQCAHAAYVNHRKEVAEIVAKAEGYS